MRTTYGVIEETTGNVVVRGSYGYCHKWLKEFLMFYNGKETYIIKSLDYN